MSFFYDLNKKLDNIRATPEVTHQQLNERDMGKHNNANTGFAALAKKTGGGEKGAKIAGAQLAKMREKGQVEEDFGPGRQGPNRNQAGPGAMSPDYENYKTPNMAKQFATAQSNDKTMGKGFSDKNFPGASIAAARMDAQGQTKYVDRTEPGIMNTLKNKLGYDMPDPAYGPKPDERERLAKRYPAPMEEGSIVDGVWTADPPKKGQPNVPAPSDPDGGILNKKTPPPAAAASRAAPPVKKTTNEGGVVDPVGEIRPGQRTPVRPSYKPEVKRITPLPKPSGAVDDDEIDESALQAAFGMKKYGEPGMKELQRLGRIGASEKTKAAARKKYNQYDESMTDEGNAFSGAVVKAKRDGIQPGEKINVGGKQYELKEVGVAPGGPGDYNYGKNYQNVTSNGQIIGTTADGGKTFISSRDEFNSGSMPQGATVDAKHNEIQTNKKDNVRNVKEAAKYRDPKYKDRLYTQEPPDDTYGPDMDDAYYNPKPDDYAGRKRPMGGSGDPLGKGFRMSADKSINTQGKRKGLPSRDQITSLKGSIKDVQGTHTPAKFADKVGRAKKEVDEMLGQVAADAMKKAVGGGRGRNAEMDEGFMDDTPTSRRSNTSGRVDTSKTGSTVHYAGKNYSGAGHDAGDENSAGSDGSRGRGRPKGSKAAIGAKINRGTSKLMTREGNQDPADQGEYDREGEMSRNEIHTMMRNAKQLEKMLGNDDDLPEWVQKKLSLASDYMQTIADYLASEKETDAEDQTGRRVEVELAEKKAKPTKKSSGNDGNLANNAKPYDKVTRGDVIAGRLGKDEMGGKSKPSKAPAKKEKEVEESTTAGSVATAPTSGKAGGVYGFGGGVYESINRAVETQINESMNISMNMSNDKHGGPRQTLTITATDEDASQLATLLKMAGMGVSTADGDYTALMPHSSEEVCPGCGMSSCGCGDLEQMDETYGDNVTDMNSPDYPTNTEQAENNFGYSGGVNKEKRDVAGNGQSTVPVTAVRNQDSEFLESIQRIREIAGLKPVSEDKAEWLKPEGMPGNEPTAKGGVEKKKEGDVWVYKPKEKGERLTTTIPSKYVDPDKKKNESIFTDTANLWKSYKG